MKVVYLYDNTVDVIIGVQIVDRLLEICLCDSIGKFNYLRFHANLICFLQFVPDVNVRVATVSHLEQEPS